MIIWNKTMGWFKFILFLILNLLILKLILKLMLILILIFLILLLFFFERKYHTFKRYACKLAVFVCSSWYRCCKLFMTNGNVHVSKSIEIKITWSQMFIDIYPASKAQKRNGTKDRIINSNDTTNGTEFENWRWSNVEVIPYVREFFEKN